jgi:hypothetical protein
MFCARCNQLKFKFTLCTWQPTQVQIHDERNKERAMIQCITSKVYFCYVCFKCICIRLVIRNLNIVEQLCIFHNFESIRTIGSNNQPECSTKLCEFLQQSNILKNCERKNYCKIFLVSPTNILFIVFEFGYLLHVHTCINNF